MKRRLTYPFLSMQTEIKKAHVPLRALMSLHFYLAPQLFPLTWEAYCLTSLTLPLLEAASHFRNLFWGDFMELSKMVMGINAATWQNPLFLPRLAASPCCSS